MLRIRLPRARVPHLLSQPMNIHATDLETATAPPAKKPLRRARFLRILSRDMRKKPTNLTISDEIPPCISICGLGTIFDDEDLRLFPPENCFAIQAWR